jgi:hypothetical protein
MLICVDDVEPGLGEEAADGGNQAGTVGAGEEEARCLVIGFDRWIIAKFGRKSLQDEIQTWFRRFEPCLRLLRLSPGM